MCKHLLCLNIHKDNLWLFVELTNFSLLKTCFYYITLYARNEVSHITNRWLFSLHTYTLYTLTYNKTTKSIHRWSYLYTSFYRVWVSVSQCNVLYLFVYVLLDHIYLKAFNEKLIYHCAILGGMTLKTIKEYIGIRCGVRSFDEQKTIIYNYCNTVINKNYLISIEITTNNLNNQLI